MFVRERPLVRRRHVGRVLEDGSQLLTCVKEVYHPVSGNSRCMPEKGHTGWCMIGNVGRAPSAARTWSGDRKKGSSMKRAIFAVFLLTSLFTLNLSAQTQPRLIQTKTHHRQ